MGQILAYSVGLVHFWQNNGLQYPTFFITGPVYYYYLSHFIWITSLAIRFKTDLNCIEVESIGNSTEFTNFSILLFWEFLLTTWYEDVNVESTTGTYTRIVRELRPTHFSPWREELLNCTDIVEEISSQNDFRTTYTWMPVTYLIVSTIKNSILYWQWTDTLRMWYCPLLAEC